MIRLFEYSNLPDAWDLHPDADPRCAGLLDLANTILEVLDMASGEAEEDDLLPHPMELVAMLKSAAERIAERTSDDDPDSGYAPQP
jgi:hypothetical protein